MPDPDKFYSKAQRILQDSNETRPLADAVVHAIVREALEPEHIGFIEALDFFFLSTVNVDGQPTVSYKGGPVGVVHCPDPKTLIFPNYDGNGMWFSMGNIVEAAKVGLLFIDMQTPHRVRVQGTAKAHKTREMMQKWPGCNMVVEVAVDAVFINCARYIHPHKRQATSKYVPDSKGQQPFPAWKRIDKLQQVLPAQDQSRTISAGGVITEDDYVELLMQGES